MVIFGWSRQPTILGSKVDQCASCGVTGTHFLIRKTWWATLFWIPVLFLRFEHGMACEACGTWTGIGFLTMRRAMQTRSLPLPGRIRRGTLEIRDQVAEETGHRPSEAELYDTVQVNPKRGFWDLMLKLWPVALVGIVAILAIGSALPRGPEPTPEPRPVAHTCWVDADGYITGCRYLDGTMDGEVGQIETICIFTEPLPSGDFTIYCPDPTPSGG